jgi:hypothetical protein
MVLMGLNSNKSELNNFVCVECGEKVDQLFFKPIGETNEDIILNSCVYNIFKK